MTSFQVSRCYSQSLRFLQGEGAPQDSARAFQLNSDAARWGHADAVLAMGWFYLNGEGVERNVREAKRWYKESARRKEPKAMFSLGQIAYLENEYAEAFQWFRRAVDAGHFRSLYWLGRLFWQGRGTELNKKEAMRLFQLAAHHKIKEAKRVLKFLSHSRHSASR